MSWLEKLLDFRDNLIGKKSISSSVLQNLCIEQIIQSSVILYALSLEKSGRVDSFDEKKEELQRKVFAYIDNLSEVNKDSG